MALQNNFHSGKETPRVPATGKYIYIALIILQSFMLYFLYYEFNVTNRMSLMASPDIKMVADIKYQTTVIHHFIWTDMPAGNTGKKIEPLLKRLDDIVGYARVMTKGEEGIIQPVTDPHLRSRISALQSVLVQYRDAVSEIYTQGNGFQTSLTSKERVDGIFRELITQTERIELDLNRNIQQEMKKFDFVKNVLVVTYLIFLFIFVSMVFLFEKKKASDFIRIRNAKQLAEKREQWLRVTMRSMGDGLITTDTTANITYINPVASSLTGWNAEDADGKNIHEIFNIINEKTRLPVINPVQEVLKRKYVVGLANHTILISKTGKEYPIADSGAPIIDNKGDCIGTVLVFHDVSERVQAENLLRIARQEWERSFNAIKDMITIQDKEMRITRANTATCSLFNAKEEDLVGRYCYELFNGSDKPCPYCPIIEGNQEIIHHETLLKNKRLGKTFQVAIAPVFDERYELEYFVHSARDVTEKATLEEDLLQARKMEAIGTLAGGIAHDFNNILTAILGYTELATETVKKIENNPELIDYLDNVEVASQRAKELVQQILTFSRKSKDEQFGPLDPHLIVKETLKLIRASLPTSIDLQIDIDRSSGTIMADPTKIQQMVMNLCTNAAQAMENDTGILQVKLDKVVLSDEQISEKENVAAGPFIELSVTDSGKGIDDATLEHIFEPYFTTKKLGKGTGMGLAMVYGIVNDYNGMIRVESEIGNGTTFRIYFPALGPKELGQKDDSGEIIGGTERILVVDDEEIIVGLHKTSLEKLGYHVTGLTSGIATWEMFQSAPEDFDLIITDQSMPQMTGKELAQKILAIRPDMPIILNTGFSSMISEKEAKSIGISEFVIKPVNRRTIAQLIRKVLDAR